VQFQITDFPRLLPELMLLVLAGLVLMSDILERWGSDDKAQIERVRASAQLTTIGLGLVLAVALVQSGYLFTVPELLPGTDFASNIANFLIGIGRNLQVAGPGDVAILGAFTIDHLTMISRLIFIGAALITALLLSSTPPSANPGEFYSLLLFATAGMCAMAGASELIFAYVALELSSISLYILAGYYRNDPRSAEAGIKYFLFGAISSGILLYGMSLAYGFTASAASGTQLIATLFTTIGSVVNADASTQPLLTLAMVLIIAGLGYKIAVVPFHSWAPDVYQGAPTIVTGFLATASKVAGFVLLYRMLTTIFPAMAGTPLLEVGEYGWTSLLMLIALVTIIVGNFAAIPQTNAKRLLAYSSIGHAGFLLLALLLWDTPLAADQTFGTSALIYYLIAYVITNLGAFGVLAAISEAVGGDDFRHLHGLWRRNLGLTVILTLMVLSLAGIPPLSGFWGKFFVFMAGYQAGAVWLVAVAVLMTVVSLFYYLRFLRVMWIEPAPSEQTFRTTPATMAALVVATVLMIGLGLVPGVVWETLGRATLAGQ
jgi:NADH-quinone oxidoreductase subunit N